MGWRVQRVRRYANRLYLHNRLVTMYWHLHTLRRWLVAQRVRPL
jgi:hypothetical protein